MPVLLILRKQCFPHFWHYMTQVHLGNQGLCSVDVSQQLHINLQWFPGMHQVQYSTHSL